MNRLILSISLLLFSLVAKGQLSIEGIDVYDDYRSPKGCMVFAPSVVKAGDTLGTVVFIHGYGALNPLNYGAWIRRIVDQGNVVIYPRYQRNLLRPGTKKFARNAAMGIRNGLDIMAANRLPADTSQLVYIGHSYGGTLSAYMLAKEDSLVLPKGYGAILAAPGTSRFSGSRLTTYQAIKPATFLAMVTHEDDYVTKTEFVELVDATLNPAVPYIWVHQERDSTLNPQLTAHHNESYALDPAFDTGYRNYTTRKALRVGTTDAVDVELYWALSDDLIAAAKERKVPSFIGNSDWLSSPDTIQQRELSEVIEIRSSSVMRKEVHATENGLTTPAEASGFPRLNKR